MRRIRAIEVTPVGSLCRRLHDDEGVTLVEMMVAILILGIVLAALAGTLVTSLASASRQESQIQANAVANGVVERLQGLTYREVALCEGEAQAAFGAGLLFEGQPVVVLADADPRCSEADRAVPTFAVTQDGRTYDIQLGVVWVDDDGDSLHPTDSQPQDYKRIVVDLGWEDRGRAHTSRTEARRAPEALDPPMSVQIDPAVTRLRDESDEAGVTGRVGAELKLRAEHLLEQDSVTVSWQDRSGATQTAVLATSDGGFAWIYTIPFNDTRLFANGETLFTFTATAPDGVITSAIARGLFLHDLNYRSMTQPTTVEVLPDGTACSLPVDAEMRGMLLSDTLDLSFSHDTVTTYSLSGVAQTANGADFAIDLAGTGGFPLLAEGATQPITATLHADRVTAPPGGDPDPADPTWTITLVGVVACTP